LSSRRSFSLSRRPAFISARSGVADRGEAAAIAHWRRLDQRSLASAWFLLLGARSGALAISQTAVQGCVLEPLCARDAPKQPRPKATTDERSRRSTPVSWAWLDLNQRPHPYQVSRAKRCADRRFPRSRASARGEGMRSNSPPGSAHRRNAVAACKVSYQPVADKAMGLPSGRGSAIGRVGPGLVERLLCNSPAICAVLNAVSPGREEPKASQLCALTRQSWMMFSCQILSPRAAAIDREIMYLVSACQLVMGLVGLNLEPYPTQRSTAVRRAMQHFCNPCGSVDATGMR
jgi:hypothetical protein